MQILIIGGAGFVGRHAGEAAKERGHGGDASQAKNEEIDGIGRPATGRWGGSRGKHVSDFESGSIARDGSAAESLNERSTRNSRPRHPVRRSATFLIAGSIRNRSFATS